MYKQINETILIKQKISDMLYAYFITNIRVTY